MIMASTALNLTKIKLQSPNVMQLTITKALRNAQLTGTSASNYLDEGVLVNNCIHCCFFKSDNVFGNSNTVTLRDYRLGYLVLPEGIQYVNYQADLKTGILKLETLIPNRSNYSESKSKQEVFTPILFKTRELDEKNNFSDFEQMPLHICSSLTLTIPPIHTVAPNPCGFLAGHNSNPFHLFYYEGYLFLPGNDKATNGKFYMIPIMLSEGLTVYYVIPLDDADVAKRHEQRLNTIGVLSKSGQAEHWRINSELKYNDHLTIVTCTEIEPSFI
jgi:hypothetical protein